MTDERYDWNGIVDGLNQSLRLRSIPIGMKLFETVEAMEAISKIRRPQAKHTTDQIVAQARQLGWAGGGRGAARPPEWRAPGTRRGRTRASTGTRWTACRAGATARWPSRRSRPGGSTR